MLSLPTSWRETPAAPPPAHPSGALRKTSPQRLAGLPWLQTMTLAGALALGAVLIALGLLWPWPGVPAFDVSALSDGTTTPHPSGVGPALLEAAKLVAAALMGALVTLVHRQHRQDRLPNPSMDQAQVLLCISGALMMILIGNSLARAFGIAGAASIIRFRTPVEDARDITILFLLMGLGMAAGLGAFAVAGLGTLFLCVMLPLLARFSGEPPRIMQVEIVSEGASLPLAHIAQVFTAHGVSWETREVSHGAEAIVRYRTTIGADSSIELLSAQLVGDGRRGIKHVAWSVPKRA